MEPGSRNYEIGLQNTNKEHLIYGHWEVVQQQKIGVRSSSSYGPHLMEKEKEEYDFSGYQILVPIHELIFSRIVLITVKK